MDAGTELFRGRRALVTGASSGLGEEFARQLAARGAALVLAARSGDRLESLAAELSKTRGVECVAVAADLSEPDGANRLWAEIERHGLAIDHLVSNAGLGSVGRFAQLDAAREACMVRVNCEAVTVLSRLALPAMLARGAGGIIHVGSIASYHPLPYQATYAATKAFVLSFSLALSEEVRGTGVRVMALCPGPVPTNFQKAAGSRIGRSQQRAVLSAEETVRRGLRAYEQGLDEYVPGTVNRVMLAAAGLLPRPTLMRIQGRIIREKMEPAAAEAGRREDA